MQQIEMSAVGQGITKMRINCYDDQTWLLREMADGEDWAALNVMNWGLLKATMTTYRIN